MKISLLVLSLIFPISSFAQIFSNPGKECLDSFKKNLFDPESSYVVAMENDGQVRQLRYRTKNRDGLEFMRYAYCRNITGENWTRSKSDEIIKSMLYTADKLNERTACIKSNSNMSYCDKKHPKIDIDDAEVILGFK